MLKSKLYQLLAATLSLFCTTLQAEDQSWMTFNVMQSIDARIPGDNQNTTYFEMEFGGTKGFIDLYGYVDVFDILDRNSDDRHGGDNFFIKLAPRFSLNRLFDSNLQLGPIQEVFISTLAEVGDNALFNEYVGVGVNLEVPWLGVVGTNVLARYVKENFGDPNQKSWDGYKFTSNWFKPIYHLQNNRFIAYQGYFDVGFGLDKYDTTNYSRASHFIEWFNGFYWHSDDFSAGYGIKYFKNMTGFQDGATSAALASPQDTTGIGHYFALIYQFA